MEKYKYIIIIQTDVSLYKFFDLKKFSNTNQIDYSPIIYKWIIVFIYVKINKKYIINFFYVKINFQENWKFENFTNYTLIVHVQSRISQKQKFKW